MIGKNDRLIKTIFQGIHEFNQDLPDEERLKASLDTILFGESGKLDSLGLVNLLLLIEEMVQEEYSLAITIADERALSQKRSPFKTIRRLSEYVSLLIEEAERG